MTSDEALKMKVNELHNARFKEFEQALIRHEELAKRDALLQTKRERRGREFMTSIGIDMKKFAAAAAEDNRIQEQELDSFLNEFRPAMVDRHPVTDETSPDGVGSEVFAEAGDTILPALISSIVTPNKDLFANVDFEWADGPIDSGWVFPDDPSTILIKDVGHYGNALCWDNRWNHPTPEFAVHFGFIPATTTTYKMTAVIAFHGFYLLRCDDSWWNCRDAEVELTVQMNVHQYTSTPWRTFPLLDTHGKNIDEVTSYDRTHSFEYTDALRAGDPVVVTVKGIVEASAHGGGAYSELNFLDGTANYIQPQFLSVRHL